MSFAQLSMQALSDVLAHLGEDVTYKPQFGAGAAIRGVFNARHQAVEAGIVVSSAQPNLLIKLPDLGSIEPDTGDEVTVQGKDYKVVNVEPDGEGGAVLFLHEID